MRKNSYCGGYFSFNIVVEVIYGGDRVYHSIYVTPMYVTSY